MKHLTRSLTSAALLLALVGCTDVSTGGRSASPANSAASASASAQVKALCDSSVAKSKAGDIAGAQADINQAIANVAAIRMQYADGRRDEFFVTLPTDWRTAPDPGSQRYYDNAVLAIDAIYKGNIGEAKRLLDMPVVFTNNHYPLYYARLDAYIIIGDFTKAREGMHYLETVNPFTVRFAKLAPYRALVGDQAQAQKDIVSALNMQRGDNLDAYNLQSRYCDIAVGQIEIGDFAGAQSSMEKALNWLKDAPDYGDKYDDYRIASNAYAIFSKNPTLCWGNPANPRRVAMGQVSKARCALALAQAKAGDIGAAKATLYFIIDEPDKIATERAIAQAGANFLQSGNVAKGIETLVVIPPAKQATAVQIRETTKTWVDIKNNKLAEILSQMTEAQKKAFTDKLELAILDCATQADQAKTMSIMAAQGGQADALALSELSNNYLNLQKILNAVYRSLKEE